MRNRPDSRPPFHPRHRLRRSIQSPFSTNLARSECVDRWHCNCYYSRPITVKMPRERPKTSEPWSWPLRRVIQPPPLPRLRQQQHPGGNYSPDCHRRETASITHRHCLLLPPPPPVRKRWERRLLRNLRLRSSCHPPAHPRTWSWPSNNSNWHVGSVTREKRPGDHQHPNPRVVDWHRHCSRFATMRRVWPTTISCPTCF